MIDYVKFLIKIQSFQENGLVMVAMSYTKKNYLVMKLLHNSKCLDIYPTVYLSVPYQHYGLLFDIARFVCWSVGQATKDINVYIYKCEFLGCYLKDSIVHL